MSYTAKSVIFDIADGWGHPSYLGIRAIDFWSSGSKISLGTADFTAYSTSDLVITYAPENAFDTSLLKTGAANEGSWLAGSGNVTNQRVIIVFDSAQTFDGIRINNFHAAGENTNNGAKNVVINYSTDSITDTTYNAAITNATEIFAGQFDEHSAVDEEDEQVLTLTVDAPQISTGASTSIARNTATLNGELTNMNEEASLDVFFQYGETTSYGTTTTAETLTAIGTFDAAITGLDNYTEYHFRAAVTNGVDTWYGEDASFTTEQHEIVFNFPTMSLEMIEDLDLEFTFPSLSINLVEFTDPIGDLDATFPSFTMEMVQTEGFTNPIGTTSAEFPSLELSLIGGASISAQFPSLQVAAGGTAGHAGDITASFPKLSFISHTGCRLEEDFPSLSLEMTAVNNVLATISGTLPQLGVVITASRASEADLDITLPMLQASMEATAGIVGSISGRLPRFSMGIVGLPGGTADLEGTFRIMKFSAAGGPSGPGTISAELPMLEMSLTSGAIESDVLRYNWERVT